MTVSPLVNLDITEYIRASWFSQQQQVTSYLPTTEDYCVSATYRAEGATVPDFTGTVLSVYNYANNFTVNGPATNNFTANGNGTVLCARLPDANITGGLEVAPCSLPNAYAGDYWVVAIGENATTQSYEWALISGGQPSIEQSDGLCTTEIGSYLGGLWIFTRATVADNATIAAARAAANALGISTSQLIDVEQAGCKYEGALIVQ
jgi:hypothetical protein